MTPPYTLVIYAHGTWPQKVLVHGPIETSPGDSLSLLSSKLSNIVRLIEFPRAEEGFFGLDGQIRDFLSGIRISDGSLRPGEPTHEPKAWGA